MHSDKKITKEDTWKPADLRRHIRDGGHKDVRRQDDTERKPRDGESVERTHRDPGKESRREREKHREQDSIRERAKSQGREKDRYLDRRKEASRDKREDKEERDRERRRERDRGVDINKYSDEYRENRDRRRDREEKENQDRERDKERNRDTEKVRIRERERGSERERDKRGEERDRERRREERDREDRTDRERRKHEESGEGERDRVRRRDREQRDGEREREHRKESERHKDESQDKRSDKERRERHAERKHSEQKEERAYREERRKDKEEGERRHKERGQHDEKPRHDRESRDRSYLKGSDGHQRSDREQKEGDKHRERRQREEQDPERNHRDRTSTKKPESDRSHKTKTAETKEVVTLSEPWKASLKDLGDTEEPVANDEELAEDQDYGDQGYEDDFEEYEEDFEEMDDSVGEGDDEKESHHPEVSKKGEELTAKRREEIKAIQRAMNEENERVGTAQTSTEEDDRPKWSRESDKNQSRASQRGKFIDFVAAKQREVSKKVANKQKKRSAELLRLIDLDYSTTFSLLDLPPVNEYDMYIKSFGTANTKQAYVQCNEDNADRDIQTEEIEMCEKWTQHPAERNGACGDPNLSQEARDKSTSEMNVDSQRLTAFLRSASQVMVVLLEEDQAEKKSLRKPKTQTDTLSFSDGSLQFNTKLPFLYGRQVSLMHFSQAQKQTMMSVHSPPEKPSDVQLDSCTIICIWNIWEPSRPQKILVYECEVRCCCFSPGKATLVFAGTSVGSVVLWDLREHASNHYCLKTGDDEWALRHPTFSTDAVLASSGHLSSVSSVEVVPSTIAGGLRPEVPVLASEEESSGLSFQLASLDENGVLNFWVVVELPKGNDAGSQTDLGLRPGGKVKLLHSSSLLTAERMLPRDAMKTGPLQTLLLKFLPTDSNHFFIGTNMGLVTHGTSHGLKAPPKLYRSQEVGVRPVDVSSIHFSPSRQHLFLVGCGDGSIRLHAVTHEQPVVEWDSSTAGEPVVSLQWAQTRPTVFCVLDAASNLYIWDLLKNDLEPVITERMNADRVTAMAVFGDSGQQNTYSGIALAHGSGKIELQYFTRDFTVASSAEEEKMESMMNEAF